MTALVRDVPVSPRFLRASRFVWVIAAVAAGFAVWNPLIDAGRHLEAAWAASLGTWLTDGHLVPVEHRVFVQPAGRPAFAVDVSRACSMVGRSLPIGVAAAALAWPHRVRAFVLALTVVALVAAVNLARIVATVVVGMKFGISSMVQFHDWVGTAMTFASWAAVLVLMLRLLTGRAATRRLGAP